MLSTLIKRGVDILATALDATTNVISAQLGDALAGIATSHSAEWIQHVGFASRPAKAVPGQGAAQAWVITASDRDLVFASRDTRGSTIYGNLKEGECCVYAPASMARTLYKADGSITHLTTYDNTATGASCTMAFTGAGVKMVWPWGSLEFSEANGLVMNHAKSGAAMALGPVAGLPAPFDVIKSTFSVSAGFAEVAAPLVNIGIAPFSNAAGVQTAVIPAASPPNAVASPIIGSGRVFIGA